MQWYDMGGYGWRGLSLVSPDRIFLMASEIRRAITSARPSTRNASAVVTLQELLDKYEPQLNTKSNAPGIAAARNALRRACVEGRMVVEGAETHRVSVPAQPMTRRSFETAPVHIPSPYLPAIQGRPTAAREVYGDRGVIGTVPGVVEGRDDSAAGILAPVEGRRAGGDPTGGSGAGIEDEGGIRIPRDVGGRGAGITPRGELTPMPLDITPQLRIPPRLRRAKTTSAPVRRRRVEIPAQVERVFIPKKVVLQRKTTRAKMTSDPVKRPVITIPKQMQRLSGFPLLNQKQRRRAMRWNSSGCGCAGLSGGDGFNSASDSIGTGLESNSGIMTDATVREAITAILTQARYCAENRSDNQSIIQLNRMIRPFEAKLAGKSRPAGVSSAMLWENLRRVVTSTRVWLTGYASAGITPRALPPMRKTGIIGGFIKDLFTPGPRVADPEPTALETFGATHPKLRAAMTSFCTANPRRCTKMIARCLAYPNVCVPWINYCAAQSTRCKESSFFRFVPPSSGNGGNGNGGNGNGGAEPTALDDFCAVYPSYCAELSAYCADTPARCNPMIARCSKYPDVCSPWIARCFTRKSGCFGAAPAKMPAYLETPKEQVDDSAKDGIDQALDETGLTECPEGAYWDSDYGVCMRDQVMMDDEGFPEDSAPRDNTLLYIGGAVAIAGVAYYFYTRKDS